MKVAFVIFVLALTMVSLAVELMLGVRLNLRSILAPFIASCFISAITYFALIKFRLQKDNFAEMLTVINLSSSTLGIAFDRINTSGDERELISEQSATFFGFKYITKPTFADLIERIEPDDRYNFYQKNVEFYESPVNSGEVLIQRVEFRRICDNDTSRWTRASMVLSLQNGRRIKFVIYEDIQSLKENESRLKKVAENRAENLVTVSHEIRTPLNAIVGLTDLLSQSRLSKTQRDYTEKIQTAADTLEAMIRNMLDLRQLDSGQLQVEAESFDTESLFDQLTILHMESAKSKGLRYITDISSNLPKTIVSDQQMLLQIVSNLMRNAMKFTEKGMVMLSASHRGGDVDTGLSHAELIIEVSDTGVGIAPDQQSLIFQPFNRGVARNALEGAGMGLSLVSRFVETLGGKVELVSRPGIGSKFSVIVPVKVVDTDPIIDRESIIGLESLRVLIVERRGIISSHLKSVLSPFVKLIEVVDSHKSAMPLLGSSEFDLVLFGYVQSSSQAKEIKNEIVAQTSFMPKVFLISEAIDLDPDLYTVFDAVIFEPFTLKQLVRSLDQNKIEFSDNKQESWRSDLLFERVLKHLNILVAEDNEINQRVFFEQLRRYGAKVSLASNGREALAALQKGTYDLVLMDIEMPVMDGLTAAERIRSQSEWRALPIIAITAGITASQKSRARAAGMNEFIGKPYRFDDLYAAIERVLLAAPVKSIQAGLFDELDVISDAGEHDVSELDVSLAQDYWPSSESFIENLELFVEKYPTADEVFTSEDPEILAKSAHSLKGAAGFLGMERYSANLSEFHKSLVNGSVSDVMLSDICQQHNRVIEEACLFLSSIK